MGASISMILVMEDPRFRNNPSRMYDWTSVRSQVTPEIIKGNEYEGHVNAKTGTHSFALRAVKLDTCGSGSYYITSGGPTVTVDYVNDVAESGGINNNLYAFPSVSSDFINVADNSDGTITITDIAGQNLFEKVFYHEQTIDLRNFASGMYFVNLRDKFGNIKTCRIIKN